MYRMVKQCQLAHNTSSNKGRDDACIRALKSCGVATRKRQVKYLNLPMGPSNNAFKKAIRKKQPLT